MQKEDNIFLELKVKGLRLTKARRAFLTILSESHIPLSAAHILSELEERGVKVNKTTVYRELERLEKMGVVHSVQLKDRKQYYELASRDHHHHLVCMQCEKVEDIDIDEKELLSEERKAKKKNKFTVLRHSLEFFGLCQKCNLVN